MQNVVIIGIGFIGINHVRAIQKSEKARLAAIIDINEEIGSKAAKEFGCAYYKTLDAAMKENIDIAIICLPTYLHEQHVINAAEHKLNILCEKPFTLTLESAQRMLKACRKNGVNLMVAQAARWTPELIAIRKMIEQQDIGNIHMLTVKRLGQHPIWSAWHSDPQKSGGGLYDLGIHDLDYLFSVFGNVYSVEAIGWQSRTKCWNHIVTNITFESGVQCSCEVSMEMPDNYPFSVGYRIVGDKGGAEYNFIAGSNIKSNTSSELWYYKNGSEKTRIETKACDVYQEEIESFVDSIESNLPLAVTNEESVQVLKLVIAIKESLENKVKVLL